MNAQGNVIHIAPKWKQSKTSLTGEQIEWNIYKATKSMQISGPAIQYRMDVPQKALWEGKEARYIRHTSNESIY